MGLNPRSCAASSMTIAGKCDDLAIALSQSAFVRGFIDDSRPSGRSQKP